MASHALPTEGMGSDSPDEALLNKLADDYNNIVYDELEDFLQQFQTLCDAGPGTSAEDLRLPVSKLPALVEACQLTHLDPSVFTAEGVTEALFKEHRKHRNRQAESHGDSTQPRPPSFAMSRGSFLQREGSSLAAGTPDDRSPGARLSMMWERVSARLPAPVSSEGRHKPTKADLAPFRKEESSQVSFSEFAAVLHIAKIEEFEPRKPPIFPFDPESKPKLLWDLIIMIFLLYTTFSVPYLLSFGEPLPVSTGDGTRTEPAWTSYDTFDLMLDCLFCTDVVINFCTAVVLRGVYVTDLHQIWFHYAKTWFFIDFFGSVPFDKIVSALVGSSGDMEGFLSAMRLIRILKIVRAVRFLQKINQLEQKDTTGTLKTFLSVFRAVFLMVFVAHFLACIFYLIVDKTPNADTGEFEDNWMSAVHPVFLDFEQTSNVERYVLGFYWAIVTIGTVGYGDILPVTHNERIFGTIAALIGGICFSYSLGSITQLIQKSNGSAKRFEVLFRV